MKNLTYLIPINNSLNGFQLNKLSVMIEENIDYYFLILVDEKIEFTMRSGINLNIKRVKWVNRQRIIFEGTKNIKTTYFSILDIDDELINTNKEKDLDWALNNDFSMIINNYFYKNKILLKIKKPLFFENGKLKNFKFGYSKKLNINTSNVIFNREIYINSIESFITDEIMENFMFEDFIRFMLVYSHSQLRSVVINDVTRKYNGENSSSRVNRSKKYKNNSLLEINTLNFIINLITKENSNKWINHMISWKLSNTGLLIKKNEGLLKSFIYYKKMFKNLSKRIGLLKSFFVILDSILFTGFLFG